MRDFALFVCPVCHGPLTGSSTALQCDSCRLDYPIKEGVPILLHPSSRFRDGGLGAEATARSRLRTAIAPILPSRLPLTTWIDRSVFQLLDQLGPDVTVVNLGSGEGTFDRYIPRGLPLINLDITLNHRCDVVADAHFLPFADGSLDAVFSNAVLEHVERPWIVAEEIQRVLKSGGWVFVNVPFLNVIHDVHDYFRFTDDGLRVLFSGFDEIRAGVSAGPSSFLGPFLVEYLVCFVPTRALQHAVRQFLFVLMWPVKFADFLIRKNPRIRITADAFYFVGVKR